MKKVLSLILVIVLAVVAAGCGNGGSTVSSGLPVKVNELAKDVNVIDELPDWTGDKLDVSVWYGYGTNDAYIGKKAVDDKFRSEIERVTGITFNVDESFDNSGQSGDTRLARMVSSNNWPMVGVGVENSIATRLIESNKLYDLTKLIPEYMPNYYSYIENNETVKEHYERRKNEDGKIYGFVHLTVNAYQYLDPEYTPEKYMSVITPTDSATWVYIRDDILKKIYPNAKTQADIQKIYLENGEFQAEDLNDVVIRSREEFKELLVKIKELNITENGKTVWPFYTHNGTDNWDLLTMLDTEFMTGIPSMGNYSYFNYFDAEKGEIVNPMKEDSFKETIKFYKSLIDEGLASGEALIDNKATWTQKKENGEYAILYGNVLPPTDEQLKAAGKNFSYRKIMIDVPTNPKYASFDTKGNALGGYNLYFFKDAMNETQLEQFLRTLDLFYTDAGFKFAEWGPEKAGLYETDADGNMKYVDEKFKKAKVDNGDAQVLVDYGVTSFPRIDYFLGTGYLNTYNPKLVYSQYQTDRIASGYTSKWNRAFFEPLPKYKYLEFNWNIWNFPPYVDGVKKFWNARQETEDAIKKIFTAKSDKEFDEYYNELISLVERNGYTDECMKEMTKVIKERNGDKLYNEFLDQAKSMLK